MFGVCRLTAGGMKFLTEFCSGRSYIWLSKEGEARSGPIVLNSFLCHHTPTNVSYSLGRPQGPGEGVHCQHQLQLHVFLSVENPHRNAS